METDNGKEDNKMARATQKKLPIGVENFEDIRTENFYYIDKTGLIK